MNATTALKSYQTVAEAAGGYEPKQIVLMLLDGVRDSMLSAKAAILDGDEPKRRAGVARALRVIDEGLLPALDFQYPLAEQMALCYEISIVNLLSANASADPRAMDAALIPILELRDAWSQI